MPNHEIDLTGSHLYPHTLDVSQSQPAKQKKQHQPTQSKQSKPQHQRSASDYTANEGSKLLKYLNSDSFDVRAQQQ